MAQHRRVRTEPAPGSDPTPSIRAETPDADTPVAEAPSDRETANDARLLGDVPPHYS